MKNYPFTKYGFTMFSKEDVAALLGRNDFTVAHAHEIQEPDFEVNGGMVKMESLIMESVKH